MLAETWRRTDLVGTSQAAEVLAHEAVHRRRAGAAASCEELAVARSGAIEHGLDVLTMLRRTRGRVGEP
jgi:hypothetical protein